MKTYYDCIPCFVRQALDSVRIFTDDEKIHEQVLREVLSSISKMDMSQSPPMMGQIIHQRIRKLTNMNDPYRDMKKRFNQFALGLYPKLKIQVESSPNPLKTAVHLSIAGNLMDLGVKSHLNESDINKAIERVMSAHLNGDMKVFVKSVSAAKNILYLADNAGEIVFDRLLIEQMPRKKVTVVVRGAAVINDATMFDAKAVGLTDLVEVIDNGSDAPGTILNQCREEFRERFVMADLIIAKGQGNYETLSDIQKDMFFILCVKCPVIARDIGCEVGSLVMQSSNNPKRVN